MKGGIAGLLFILVAATGQFIPPNTLKEPTRVPPETIPAPDWSRRVADPKSSPALLLLDQQVASYGIDERFYRSVVYTHSDGDPLSPDDDHRPALGTMARVNYWLRGQDELGSGVVVYINTWTGETLIVPHEVIRAADRVVVRAGIDLTLLSRTAEKAGKRIHLQYHYRGADDGVFVVKVEPHTAKADQKIYWWDGRIGRAHFQ